MLCATWEKGYEVNTILVLDSALTPSYVCRLPGKIYNTICANENYIYAMNYERVLWKYIRLICLFSFFLCLFPNCNSNKKNKMVEQNISSLLNQDVDRLKGRQILSLDSVVGETEKCVIVYIFNYYDCETCIDKGFEIVNLIDNSKKREYVKVIVSMFMKLRLLKKGIHIEGLFIKTRMI